jgi:hypothetical protein
MLSTPAPAAAQDSPRRLALSLSQVEYEGQNHLSFQVTAKLALFDPASFTLLEEPLGNYDFAVTAEGQPVFLPAGFDGGLARTPAQWFSATPPAVEADGIHFAAESTTAAMTWTLTRSD